MKKALLVASAMCLLWLSGSSAWASEIEFDNNSSMSLYVWPVPDNDLPSLQANMPPHSLGIKVSTSYPVKYVLIFDEVGMAHYKKIRESTICGYFNLKRVDAKGVITASYRQYLLDCNQKTIAYIKRLNADPLFANSFVLDASKRWAAFNLAIRTTTTSVADIISSKRIGFAVKH